MLETGEEILKQTPEMLPVLKKAGVVDSGGRGILVIFTGFYRYLMGEEDLEFTFEDDKQPQSLDDVIADINNLGDIEFGYCTEYMIIHMHKKTTEADIDKLREKLMEIGDSVICIGDLSLVKVHVHTNEPNKALQYALELGELFNLKIENMREQNRELKKKAQAVEESKEMGMISVAPGDGLATIFKELTVDEIIVGGQTMNPSAEDIANAAEKVPARTVFVFPNNKNIIMAAEKVDELSKKNVCVVPTASVTQGIRAAMAFDSEQDMSVNCTNMSKAFKDLTCGEVTHAVRNTNMDGFSLHEGDIIGLSNSKIVAQSKDISETTEKVVQKLMGDFSETITLYYGSDVKDEDAQKLTNDLQAKYPDYDVACYNGGQPHYYYFIAVE